MVALQIFVAWLKERAKDDRGAAYVEYAFLVALVTIVCLISMTFLGQALSDLFTHTKDELDAP